MAQPITCDNEHGVQADFILSNTATGDTLALCGPCLVVWCKQMIAAAEPEAAAPKSNGRRGKVAEHVETETTVAPVPGDVPATADTG